ASPRIPAINILNNTADPIVPKTDNGEKKERDNRCHSRFHRYGYETHLHSRRRRLQKMNEEDGARLHCPQTLQYFRCHLGEVADAFAIPNYKRVAVVHDNASNMKLCTETQKKEPEKWGNVQGSTAQDTRYSCA
ncbi:hypothetical protein F7725_015836, partial [Dissostichus mawsoni]